MSDLANDVAKVNGIRISSTERKLTLDDASEVLGAVRDAERLMEMSPRWLAWLAAKAFKRLHEPVQLVSSDLDVDPTSGAGDLRIRAQLADEFVLFVTALRAGDGEPGAAVDFELEHGRFLKKEDC